HSTPHDSHPLPTRRSSDLKEAHRMKATNVKSEKTHAPSVQESELVVVQNQSDEIPVLEWLGVRVVTTKILAKGYGTDADNIKKKDRKSTRLNSSHVSISYA